MLGRSLPARAFRGGALALSLKLATRWKWGKKAALLVMSFRKISFWALAFLVVASFVVEAVVGRKRLTRGAAGPHVEPQPLPVLDDPGIRGQEA